jgi:hypothetical protein
MTKAKKYRSEAFAAIHETMEALHEVGAIDKRTMREFDEACLTSTRVLTPEEIRADPRARARLAARPCPLSQRPEEPGLRLGARREEARRPGLAAPHRGAKKGLQAIA